jgi:hypothetical protein
MQHGHPLVVGQLHPCPSGFVPPRQRIPLHCTQFAYKQALQVMMPRMNSKRIQMPWVRRKGKHRFVCSSFFAAMRSAGRLYTQPYLQYYPVLT